MHYCLQLPEIVDMICRELQHQPSLSSVPSRHYEPHLVAMAQVSKFISHIALDYVWMRVSTLRAFQCCLPHDVTNPFQKEIQLEVWVLNFRCYFHRFLCC